MVLNKVVVRKHNIHLSIICIKVNLIDGYNFDLCRSHGIQRYSTVFQEFETINLTVNISESVLFKNVKEVTRGADSEISESRSSKDKRMELF